MQNSKETLDDYNTSVDETTNSELAHMARITHLRDELSKVVDENGKVKDGYKERASFILGELSTALGREYSLTGDVINKYKELEGEIDKTINKKKADIVIAGEAKKWENAYNSQQESLVKQNTAYHALEDAAKEYGITVDKIQDKADELKNAVVATGNIAYDIYKENEKHKEGKRLQELIDAYKTATDTVKTETETMKKYDDMLVAYANEDYEKITNIVETKTKEWTDYSLQQIKESLQAQGQELRDYAHSYETTENELAKKRKEAAEENIKNLAENLRQRTSTIGNLGQDEIDAWKELAKQSYDVYEEQLCKMPSEMAQNIQNITGVVITQTPEVVSSAQQMSQKVVNEIDKDSEFKAKALKDMYAFLNGLSDSNLRALLETAGVQNVDKVIQGIRKGNLAENEGINILKSLNNGLQNSSFSGTLFATARSIASRLSGLLTVRPTVSNVITPFKGGITAPGHKLGLDYVPKDNYLARLHKGERVLTAKENKEYTEAIETLKQDNKSVNSNIGNSKGIINAIYDMNSKMEILLNQLIDITKQGSKQQIILDTGTLVGETTPMYDATLGALAQKRERGG